MVPFLRGNSYMLTNTTIGISVCMLQYIHTDIQVDESRINQLSKERKRRQVKQDSVGENELD